MKPKTITIICQTTTARHQELIRKSHISHGEDVICDTKEDAETRNNYFNDKGNYYYYPACQEGELYIYERAGCDCGIMIVGDNYDTYNDETPGYMGDYMYNGKNLYKIVE